MRAPTPADDAVEALATRQHGVVSLAQTEQLGITRSQRRHRLDRREWVPLAPGVFGFPGHADSHRRRCWIAWLHAGDEALLCRGAAALLLGLWPIDGEPVDLMVRRGASRALPGTTRHRPRRWPGSHQVVDGLAVTGPARTIVELAAVMRPARLVQLVEHAEVDRICSVTAVGAELGRVRGRGVPGVRRLEVVLDQLGPGEGVPRSELERLGDRVRRLAELPDPVHEHPLPSAAGRKGFVDRAWPDVRLIVEIDGRRWHTRRSQVELDHRRDLEAAAMGWQTLRLGWEQLHDDPVATAVLWRAAYEQRLALVRGAS